MSGWALCCHSSYKAVVLGPELIPPAISVGKQKLFTMHPSWHKGLVDLSLLRQIVGGPMDVRKPSLGATGLHIEFAAFGVCV